MSSQINQDGNQVYVHINRILSAIFQSQMLLIG